MTDKSSEKVLCVLASVVNASDGLTFDQHMIDVVMNCDAAHRYIERARAETDEFFRQIIPYVIVYHDESRTFLRYRRGRSGDENRLHAKKSIGVGGHINPEDGSILQAAAREITEEIGLVVPYVPEPVAIVYDTETEVGRVHLGLVIVLKIAEKPAAATCPSLTDMEFVSFTTLVADQAEYERWSQFCIRNIPELVAFQSRQELVEKNTLGRERGSVVQSWVTSLSLMQQTVLLTSIRGPDTVRKFHAAKILYRWLRRCLLLSAFDRKPLLDPDEPGGGSFIGPCKDAKITNLGHAVDEYFRVVDELPLHAHLHLVHASEILGYKHPVASIRYFWHSLYLKFAKDFHMTPETEDQMNRRLGDRIEDWEAHETISPS